MVSAPTAMRNRSRQERLDSYILRVNMWVVTKFESRLAVVKVAKGNSQFKLRLVLNNLRRVEAIVAVAAQNAGRLLVTPDNDIDVWQCVGLGDNVAFQTFSFRFGVTSNIRLTRSPFTANVALLVMGSPGVPL